MILRPTLHSILFPLRRVRATYDEPCSRTLYYKKNTSVTVAERESVAAYLMALRARARFLHYRVRRDRES